MKVNLQKVIALTVAVAVIISILNISVYATSEPTAMTNKEYYAAQSYLIDKFCDGDITYSQFQEQSQAVTNEYITANTVGGVLQSGALNASNNISAISQKIGATVDKWGDGARELVSDWWNSVCTKNNVPTETTQTSTTDIIDGYCACIVVSSASSIVYTYCQYAVIDVDNGTVTLYAPHITETHYYHNGSTFWSSVDTKNITWDPYLTSQISAYYGDIRYKDGTQAPTDDEFIVGTIKNFDDMSERDLEDLVDDFAEEMELQNPDLSSIEGLLNAIYARLGTLDSDNDNQLLSEILAAIKAIKSSETDNTELLELLEDIKNSLVFGDDENKETFSEQLKKIIDNQISRDDFVIDEDLYNNHGEILKERLLGKFSFIYNMKTFVEYCFEEYSNTSESPEFNIEYDGKSYSIDLNAFNDHLSTIQFILAAFIYLNYAYHTYRKIPSYINGGDNE